MITSREAVFVVGTNQTMKPPQRIPQSPALSSAPADCKIPATFEEWPPTLETTPPKLVRIFFGRVLEFLTKKPMRGQNRNQTELSL